MVRSGQVPKVTGRFVTRPKSRTMTLNKGTLDGPIAELFGNGAVQGFNWALKKSESRSGHAGHSELLPVG